MRISDWSSDVCSSDLDARYLLLLCEHHVGPLQLLPRGDRTWSCLCALRSGVERRPRQPGLQDAEIGRASCCERVCTYGCNSVVAVSLKKKTQVQQTRHYTNI